MDIDKEIEHYKKIQNDLELNNMSKWVLIYNQKLIGIYDSFESAAEEAVCKFGRGPYLIRRVGEPPLTLPASVMYRFKHA